MRINDETTPLLTEIEPEPILPGDDGVESDREVDDADEQPVEPLPRLQVFLLCFTSVAAPIAFFSIFPYINFMIERVGNVKKEDVGFYSGLIESLFSATQMCVMIFWGKVRTNIGNRPGITDVVKASDRWGRKPVLVVSLLGMSAATTLFGMSRTLWQMILFRCTAGVFAGTVITVRAMLSEISTKHTQARAFSFFSFAGNLGIFVGPLIGTYYWCDHATCMC